MISQLELMTFKCFERLRLPLGPLTLLSGTNASGKSSVMQSLVLLHQSFLEDANSFRISLNGDMIKLGTVTDVVDQVTGKNSILLGLADEEGSVQWSFSGDRTDMSMKLEKLVVDGIETVLDSAFQESDYGPMTRFNSYGNARNVVGAIERLNFIAAEREGPREFYPLKDMYALMRLRPLDVVSDPYANEQLFSTRIGSRGENAISILYWRRDEPIADALRIPGIVPTLMHQVGARMDTFFPGCSVNVQPVQQANRQANAVTLGIRMSEATEYLRPIHCGFGITQVLPIVISALSIPQNDLLLIENPEAHLHPAGQALMGQFLAEMANFGIQVIVETHSDHVLNGIRRAVKSGIIPSEKVVLHFFRARTPDSPQVLSPVIDNSGNVDVWPEGFFDQFDKDMDYFAGWGK